MCNEFFGLLKFAFYKDRQIIVAFVTYQLQHPAILNGQVFCLIFVISPFKFSNLPNSFKLPHYAVQFKECHSLLSNTLPKWSQLNDSTPPEWYLNGEFFPHLPFYSGKLHQLKRRSGLFTCEVLTRRFPSLSAEKAELEIQPSLSLHYRKTPSQTSSLINYS